MPLDFTFLCTMKELPSKVSLSQTKCGQGAVFFFFFFFLLDFQNVADRYRVLLCTSSSQLVPRTARKFSTILTGM